MNPDDNSSLIYSEGDVLRVKTFAGPVVLKKVKRLVRASSSWSDGIVVKVSGFEGCFVRRKDLLALKNAHVPFSGKEKLSETITFTYDNQIIERIKKA